MYSVTETPVNKVLFVQKTCRKYFVSGGKLVKLDSNGIAVLDKDAKIGVCKFNHWENHRVRMVKNRQVLSDNAIITEKELSGNIAEILEEEILLASLEVLETL